jgi:ubiquinone/menaquinone biosynthesis C-methylase UbiE
VGEEAIDGATMPSRTTSRAGQCVVTMTDDVTVDRTAGYDYGKLVQEEVDEYNRVAVTEDLLLGGIHAQKAWQYWFEYLAARVWKTDLVAEILQHDRPTGSTSRDLSIGGSDILSLGCGFGGYELMIAEQLRERSYELTAVDINPALFADAQKTAIREGFNIRWTEADLNFIKIPESAFDVVYAHASLHHVLNLEHVFEQVYRGLKADGLFVVVEPIGKSDVLFWQDNLDIAVDIVRNMPERYKIGITDPSSVIDPYTKPHAGMEGIRQEEIPSLIMTWFEPVKLFTYGAFIRILCTHPVIGNALDPSRPEEREYLEELFRLDLTLVREGRARPTEMFAVLKKRTTLDPATSRRISSNGKERWLAPGLY